MANNPRLNQPGIENLLTVADRPVNHQKIISVNEIETKLGLVGRGASNPGVRALVHRAKEV